MPINIGHENFVVNDLVAVILKTGSLHVRKIRQYAAEKGLLFNATSGRKIRSVIVLTTSQVTLSSLQSITVKARAEEKEAVLINIGYENFLNLNIVAAILKPNSSPVKKLRQDVTDKGLLLNATSGNKTRSVIVLTTGQVVLSSLHTTTVKAKAERKKAILINVGYENFINKAFVALFMETDSAHAKKLRQDAMERGLLVNATSGHKMRSAVVLTTSQIVLSSIQTITLEARAKDPASTQLDWDDDKPF